ncbi:multiple epidermal growth factor-like domains protein 10 [Liolophura sinensis]|uniref:multiple epidermal growth factor-like domains protein 10 n=1 Tax=Liolophura sinensis TaxID=3198878 RepID=UPI0031599254
MSLIFTILILHAVKADGQTCRFGRSGAGCRYNCNCAEDCDRQTGCAGNCSAGWDGPTCQRCNVALHQMTNQLSNYSENNWLYISAFAVDGKVGHILESTPCTHTMNDLRSWWTVTLNRTYSIYTFQIYNRVENCGNGPEPCSRRLNGFTLSVGTNNQSYNACYTDTTTTNEGPGVIINGSCNDGNPRTGNTVQISLPLESSRALTLCEVRLFVCSEGWYGEMCDKECVTDTCCSRCDDHGLRCEKCVNGRWGTDCGEECGHCWNNTACDKDTSECPNLSPRCESGFQGYNCTTNCSSYTWGPDCKETCGQCHGGAVCDRVSGNCPLENPHCAIGYTGPRCEPCPRGTFGNQCREECGQCKDGNHTCDHVNGTCTSCADGWLGDLCKEEYDEDDEDDEDVVADVASAGLVNSGAVQESTCVAVEEFRRYMLRKKTSMGFKAEFEVEKRLLRKSKLSEHTRDKMGPGVVRRGIDPSERNCAPQKVNLTVAVNDSS